MNKEKIIAEIKRTALGNGGRPLGRDRFEKETGISSWEIGKHWARFSDAQLEAGFSPNQLNAAIDEILLLNAMVELIRELNRFPIRGEMRLKRTIDPSFPNNDVFYRRFGNKESLAKKVSDYSQSKGYEDVVKICSEIIEDYSNKVEHQELNDENLSIGSVYLFKSGRYYKIGKTTDTVRRGNELRIQLPEKLDLIHSITTDDPSGVEAYWHKRYSSKRMNGEWFNLNSNDIKSFKRWKKVV